MEQHQSNDLLALYGTLMSKVGGVPGLGLETGLELVGPCRIPGRLLDLGHYPGLIESSGGEQVLGELHRLVDPRLQDRLDEFEGYSPVRRSSSHYLRKRVRLIEPNLDAWVYVFNQSTEGRSWIESGDWAEHSAR